ncbi:MAG: ABC transporter permease [Opitutaceae bacterium]
MMPATKPSLVQALILEPARMVGGLWRHRELIWQFTHRAIELRHRGSRLGPLWALVNPLSMLVLYFFVFGRLYGTRFGTLPGETEFDFSLALFLGLSLFHVFTETLSASPAMITGNPNFVKKVVFPLEILPVAQVGAALFHFLAGLTLIVTGSFFGSAWLGWGLAWVPVIVLPLALLSLGIGWALAAIGVFLRDIGQITGFVATALLFASAVMYPPSKIPEGLDWLRFNPLLQIVDLARRTVLWHEPMPWATLGQVYAVAMLIFAAGAVLFSLLRRSFAEVV